jgi:hypothetical protein
MKRLHLLITILACAAVLGAWSVYSHAQQPALNSSEFQVDPLWPKPLPNDWVTGNVGGTCVDKNDHVFITNRTADAENLTPNEKAIGHPAPPVIEFDQQGNVVNSWGDFKVVPNGIHDCYFDPDGNVWIGGNTDAIAQKYTHDGKLLMQIGTKGKFDSADNSEKAEGLNASHTLLNKPASFAVDPANGELYIADGYGNRRVVVFDKSGNYIRQFGRQAQKGETEKGVGGVFEGVVHCVIMTNDGLLYVCDREGKRIQVFDKAGNFKKNIMIPRRRADLPGNGKPYWILLSHDKGQKTMWIADGLDEVVWTVDRDSGKPLRGFGRLGHMAGEFTFLHTIAMDSKGNLITGETIGGRRAQRFNAARE